MRKDASESIAALQAAKFDRLQHQPVGLGYGISRLRRSGVWPNRGRRSQGAGMAPASALTFAISDDSLETALSPRILGATRRRFEAKRYSLYRRAKMRALTQVMQFSREANSEGLRRAYVRWPLDSRLKRRRSRKRSGVAQCVVDQQQSP